MDRCECCGRHPAKRFAAKINRGLFFSRRLTTIDGVFCRDCAQGALANGKAEAGDVPLDPQWLNRNGRWDSRKLGNLPPEVKDEPWTRHKVTCPHCDEAFFGFAGPAKCRACNRSFVVGSCAACSTVHAIKVDAAAAVSANLDCCRECGHRTEHFWPVRNWPMLLIGQAIAEIAADVAAAGGDEIETERVFFRETVGNFPEYSPELIRWLEDYFEQCLKGKAIGTLTGCVAHCKRSFHRESLRIGIAMAEVGGAITFARRQVLERLAARLGMDLDRELGGRPPPGAALATVAGSGWWSILGVSPEATREQIEAAYRRQARKHHPDRLYDAPAPQRKAAEDRMKSINAAFVEARAAAVNPFDPKGTRPIAAAKALAARVQPYNAARWIAASPQPLEYVARSRAERLATETARWYHRKRFLWMLVAAGFAILAWVLKERLALFDYHERIRGVWKWDAIDWMKFVAVAGAVGAVVGAFYRRTVQVALGAIVIAVFLGLMVVWFRGLSDALDYEQQQRPEYRTF
jgi:hypothetical protein